MHSGRGSVVDVADRAAVTSSTTPSAIPYGRSEPFAGQPSKSPTGLSAVSHWPGRPSHHRAGGLEIEPDQGLLGSWGRAVFAAIDLPGSMRTRSW